MGEQRPTLQRLQLGAALRRAREAAGKLQENSAEALDCYTSKISRVETGRTGLKAAELEKLLDLYGVDGAERDELLTLGKATRRKERRRLYGDTLPNWFRRYVDLEADATEIRTHECELIPGLLQTEDYARALIRAALFGAGSDEVDRRVRIRMDRQDILTRPSPPRLWCVIGEAAFRRPVGGQVVLQRQIEHLLEVAAEPTSVVVQVLPFSVGEHAAVGIPFTLLSFGGSAPEVGYMDALTMGGNYVERDEVWRLIDLFDQLRATALGPRDSRRHLRALVRER